jgi:hypothetical protein
MTEWLTFNSAPALAKLEWRAAASKTRKAFRCLIAFSITASVGKTFAEGKINLFCRVPASGYRYSISGTSNKEAKPYGRKSTSRRIQALACGDGFAQILWVP